MIYDWNAEGVWLEDGHNWNFGIDVPNAPREETGETVVLQPPKFVHRDVASVECKIYYVPSANIYVAICENAYNGISVLFYDKISCSEEFQRRWPDIQLSWD